MRISSCAIIREELRPCSRKFAPLRENRLVRQGLENLWEKFQRLDASGPIWLANFLELEGEDREFTQLDAFERVSGLLQALGVP